MSNQNLNSVPSKQLVAISHEHDDSGQRKVVLFPSTRKRRSIGFTSITPEQVAALIAAADTERDKLLLRTLWVTGGRISEVLELTASQIVLATPMCDRPPIKRD